MEENRIMKIKEKAKEVWRNHKHKIVTIGGGIAACALFEYTRQKSKEDEFVYRAIITDDGETHDEIWELRESDGTINRVATSAPHHSGRGVYSNGVDAMDPRRSLEIESEESKGE